MTASASVHENKLKHTGGLVCFEQFTNKQTYQSKKNNNTNQREESKLYMQSTVSSNL